MNEREKALYEAVKSFVNWWDEWTSADCPTDLEDPPIETYRKLLALAPKNTGANSRDND